MMRNYGTPPIALVRGEGCLRVGRRRQRRYLDLLGGIAVSSLGHAHPAVVEAVVAPGRHARAHQQPVPSTSPASRWPSGCGARCPAPTRVFLCQDGATANEAALKLVRKHGQRAAARGGGRVDRGRLPRPHAGRAVRHRQAGQAGAVRAAARRRSRSCPYGDVEALARRRRRRRTAAVILEPVQGEGGVVVPPAGYLAAARAICDDAGALLVVDEVQTGIGRTGEWFIEHRRRASCPTSSRWPRASAAGCRSAPCWRSGRRPTCSCPGDHGSDLRRQPGLVRRRARRARRRSSATACSTHVAARRASAGPARSTRVDHPLLAGAPRRRAVARARARRAGRCRRSRRAARDAGFLVNAVRPDVDPARAAAGAHRGRGRLASSTALPDAAGRAAS